MKKNKIQGKFFEELRTIPIVQVACEKSGVSRNSVYRWKKEDKSFSKKMDQALADGVAFVSDMSESQLLTLIKEKVFLHLAFGYDIETITTKPRSKYLDQYQQKKIR